MSKRVLGALRLSRDQDESTSIEGQREQIERWAAARGYAVTAWAEDVDVSGGVPSLDRPDLKRKLADPASFDIVAGIKIDRLSRDTADFLSFAGWLNQRGKWLVSTGESICLKGDGSASDMANATVLAAFATMERQRMAERARDSRARLARAGRWGGGVAPFGYMIVCLCHGSPGCPTAPRTAGKVLVRTRPRRPMPWRWQSGPSPGTVTARSPHG